jgi:hypothetical protein
MQGFVGRPAFDKQTWTYARLAVVDGDRRLKPSSVCFDYVTFPDPPRLTSAEIEIILTAGPEEDRRMARVLPHDPGDTRIPIQLL